MKVIFSYKMRNTCQNTLISMGSFIFRSFHWKRSHYILKSQKSQLVKLKKRGKWVFGRFQNINPTFRPALGTGRKAEKPDLQQIQSACNSPPENQSLEPSLAPHGSGCTTEHIGTGIARKMAATRCTERDLDCIQAHRDAFISGCPPKSMRNNRI